MAQGYLQVDVVSDVNNFPVQDAEITISSVDTPETVIRRLMTNSSGQTENVVLEAPPKALSLRPATCVHIPSTRWRFQHLDMSRR